MGKRLTDEHTPRPESASEARPPVSAFKAGLACRCPRCGEGRLFDGYLQVAERCAVCGLPIGRHDSGDGPAVFIILILGFVVVGLALWVEATFRPALWVHAILWPPLIIGGALGMLRPFKATLIALQYKHRAEDLHAGE